MFKLVKNLNGRVEAPDVIELTAKAGTYAEGVALAYDGTDHVLAPAGATAKPLFIAAEGKTLSAAGKLLVYRITDGMIFETAAAGAVVGGAKYTLGSSSDSITTTTTSGVITVLESIAAAGTTLVCVE